MFSMPALPLAPWNEPLSDESSSPSQRSAGDVEQWLVMLERIVDSSDNMVVVTDMARRIKWVNAAYTRVTGWTLQECLGKRPSDFLHGPDTDRSQLGALADLLNQGRSASEFELVNYRKSGEPYRVSMNIEPVRDAKGEVCAYLSIQSDVSERHRQEERTTRLKARLEEAQRLARLGRIEIDDDTGLSRWSDEVFRMVGLEPDAQLRSFSDLLDWVEPGSREAVVKDCNRGIEAGEEIQVEFQIRCQGGGCKWVRCRGLPLPLNGGFTAPLTWSVLDVSFYKVRFEEKRQRNEELNRLVVERTRKLQESNKALEEFSYALSHDLRSPLRHMASFAELLKEELHEGASPEALSYCNRIIESAGRMRALIEGMLSFAQLGRDALQLEWTDLGGIILDLAQGLSREKPGQPIEWQIQPDLPLVQCDAVLMREVWANLLDNAAKYSADRSPARIVVAGHEVDGGWEFSVRDNGAGFDEAHAQQLFGMFQRMHTGKRFKGAGIGLALARRIVDSHGGRIWARAAVDQGATFHVFLPLAPAPLDADAALPDPPVAGTA